jgi:hypothetical protein
MILEILFFFLSLTLLAWVYRQRKEIDTEGYVKVKPPQSSLF